MSTETILYAALILSAFLCSLVAGFLFAFAIVAMPGIGKLVDREFIRAFQVMDGVIQKNQPIFMLVWVGSVLSLIVAAVFGIFQLEGVDRLLLIGAAVAYFFCVQLPTLVINVPLNNKIQTVDIDALDKDAAKEARKDFEPRWNFWNAFRTVFSCVTSLLLIIVLFRI